MSEQTLQTSILKWLNRQPGCIARNRHIGPMDTAGDPDITGCWNGYHLEIEVKLPGKKPRPLQVKRLAEWRDAGAIAFTATALCEVEREFGRYRIGELVSEGPILR